MVKCFHGGFMGILIDLREDFEEERQVNKMFYFEQPQTEVFCVDFKRKVVERKITFDNENGEVFVDFLEEIA